MHADMEIESHPWPPFIPPQAHVLIMGTFPPAPLRWCMNFYYPNRTNDFWHMMGLIMEGDRYAYYDIQSRSYRLESIKRMLNEKGIALNDTGHRIRRLKGNASDKYLEIVEPVDLTALLSKMPECKNIATTGEKAASVIASLTDTEVPAMGCSVQSASGLTIWRMPSTSRAYPLPIDKKAQYYRNLFLHCHIPCFTA